MMLIELVNKEWLNEWIFSYLLYIQVAKSHGGSNAANQVAYLWAKSLGNVDYITSY